MRKSTYTFYKYDINKFNRDESINSNIKLFAFNLQCLLFNKQVSDGGAV